MHNFDIDLNIRLYKFIGLKDICITAKVSEFLIYGWMFVKGGKDYEKWCATVTFHMPNKTINSYADSSQNCYIFTTKNNVHAT
jgi:hypothetical protein